MSKSALISAIEVERVQTEGRNESDALLSEGYNLGLGRAVNIIRQHEAPSPDNPCPDHQLRIHDVCPKCGMLGAAEYFVKQHEKKLTDIHIDLNNMLNPDMSSQELRLHMGELTAGEERTARAAIRWANSAMGDVRIAREEQDVGTALPSPAIASMEGRSIQNVETPTVSGNNLAVSAKRINSTLIGLPYCPFCGGEAIDCESYIECAVCNENWRSEHKYTRASVSSEKQDSHAGEPDTAPSSISGGESGSNTLIQKLKEELDATIHLAAEPQHKDGGLTYMDGLAKAISIAKKHAISEMLVVDDPLCKRCWQNKKESREIDEKALAIGMQVFADADPNQPLEFDFRDGVAAYLNALPVREQGEITWKQALYEIVTEQLDYEQSQNREAMRLLDEAKIPRNGEEGQGKRQSLTLSQRIARLLKREYQGDITGNKYTIGRDPSSWGNVYCNDKKIFRAENITDNLMQLVSDANKGATMLEYRPHPDTSMTIRIKNALHELNLKRPDIAALPDGTPVSRNISIDRNIGALLEDILTQVEDKPQREIVDNTPECERWNLERTADGKEMLVCRNAHDKGDKCRYERWIPAIQIDDIPVREAEGDTVSSQDLSRKPDNGKQEENNWRSIDSAPRNGTPISAPHTVRYLPYKPDGKRQMKVEGRWQEHNGFGWQNIDWEPAVWQPLVDMNITKTDVKG